MLIHALPLAELSQEVSLTTNSDLFSCISYAYHTSNTDLKRTSIVLKMFLSFPLQ